MIRPEYLEVEILEEWMGNPPHSIMNLLKEKALDLIEKGSAKYVETEPKVLVKDKQIENPPMNKMVSKPSMSKMISKAPAKKAGRPKKKN